MYVVLDAELVRRGLSPSRTQAQELISAHRVMVGGAVADKSARQVDPGGAIEVEAGQRVPRRSRGPREAKVAETDVAVLVDLCGTHPVSLAGPRYSYLGRSSPECAHMSLPSTPVEEFPPLISARVAAARRSTSLWPAPTTQKGSYD